MYAPKTHAALAAVFAASLGLIATAAPARAATMDDPSVAVSYDDLNLANESDIARLNGRISRAAVRVCGVRGARGVAEAQRAAECRREAIESAQRGIDLAIAEHANTVQIASRGSAN